MSEYSISYFSQKNLILKILLIFDVTGAAYWADLLIVALIRDRPKFHHCCEAGSDFLLTAALPISTQISEIQSLRVIYIGDKNEMFSWG